MDKFPLPYFDAGHTVYILYFFDKVDGDFIQTALRYKMNISKHLCTVMLGNTKQSMLFFLVKNYLNTLYN